MDLDLMGIFLTHMVYGCDIVLQLEYPHAEAGNIAGREGVGSMVRKAQDLQSGIDSAADILLLGAAGVIAARRMGVIMGNQKTTFFLVRNLL